MLGRLFSLALGFGLVALAVLINRPDLYGTGAPHVNLGLYEVYRNVVGITIGMMGGIIVIAAILRKGATAERRAAAHDGMTIDLGDEPTVEATTHSRTFEMDTPMSVSRSTSGGAVASPLW